MRTQQYKRIDATTRRAAASLSKRVFGLLCTLCLLLAAPMAHADDMTLCADTYGTWNWCGSGCGPLTCSSPTIPDDVFCPAVCNLMCDCPGWAPLWDAELGCVDSSACEDSDLDGLSDFEDPCPEVATEDCVSLPAGISDTWGHDGFTYHRATISGEGLQAFVYAQWALNHFDGPNSGTGINQRNWSAGGCANCWPKVTIQPKGLMHGANNSAAVAAMVRYTASENKRLRVYGTLTHAAVIVGDNGHENLKVWLFVNDTARAYKVLSPSNGVLDIDITVDLSLGDTIEVATAGVDNTGYGIHLVPSLNFVALPPPTPDESLCADTYGTWLWCGSGCGPLTCSSASLPDDVICPAVCTLMCECPSWAPLWDEEQGCVPTNACEDSDEDGLADNIDPCPEVATEDCVYLPTAISDEWGRNSLSYHRATVSGSGLSATLGAYEDLTLFDGPNTNQGTNERSWTYGGCYTCWPKVYVYPRGQMHGANTSASIAAVARYVADTDKTVRIYGQLQHVALTVGNQGHEALKAWLFVANAAMAYKVLNPNDGVLPIDMTVSLSAGDAIEVATSGVDNSGHGIYLEPLITIETIAALSPEEELCADTSGNWNMCGSGCGPNTCDNPVSESDICIGLCVPLCECPDDKPVWDDTEGCVSQDTCTPTPEGLCASTDGSWNMCGSGCGPNTCDNPVSESDICIGLCVPLCECPNDKPVWDDTEGCVSQDTCTLDLCASTGGAWSDCGSGCGPNTCDNQSTGGFMICPDVCTPMCVCPADTPIWDESLGCVSQDSCGPSAQGLCADTGGTWDWCGSGCGPTSCETLDPDPNVVCLAVCTEMCACPADTPVWDETLGCVSADSCEEAVDGALIERFDGAYDLNWTAGGVPTSSCFSSVLYSCPPGALTTTLTADSLEMHSTLAPSARGGIVTSDTVTLPATLEVNFTTPDLDPNANTGAILEAWILPANENARETAHAMTRVWAGGGGDDRKTILGSDGTITTGLSAEPVYEAHREYQIRMTISGHLIEWSFIDVETGIVLHSAQGTTTMADGTEVVMGLGQKMGETAMAQQSHVFVHEARLLPESAGEVTRVHHVIVHFASRQGGAMVMDETLIKGHSGPQEARAYSFMVEAGAHVLALTATGTTDPRGLIAAVEVDGQLISVTGDQCWLSAPDPTTPADKSWHGLDFDDTAWTSPTACAEDLFSTYGDVTEAGASWIWGPSGCDTDTKSRMRLHFDTPLDPAQDTCAPTEHGLCAHTGGAWSDCGSGCGPNTCDNQSTGGFMICPDVCTPMCVCPADTPIWDDTLGCVSQDSCGPSAQGLCADTGGTWDWCGSGCGPTTCETLNPESNFSCLAVCTQMCACPADTPVWDETQGCISADSCIGTDGSCQTTGDLNQDGATNLLDVLQLVQAIVDPSTDFDANLADLNCDESVNLLDVLELVARIVGG